MEIHLNGDPAQLAAFLRNTHPPSFLLPDREFVPASVEATVIDICRPRMQAVEGGAVLLPDFGLMFTAATIGKASNWQNAKEMAGKVDLLGFKDWRLPEREELQLLIRSDRHNPAIDTELFPDTKTDDWYWTNTTRASSPSDYAWDVDFHYGGVYSLNQYFTGFVRAVRRVPASQ